MDVKISEPSHFLDMFALYYYNLYMLFVYVFWEKKKKELMRYLIMLINKL